VVFIRELVPKPAVAAIARFAFNENYSCVPMSHGVEIHGEADLMKAEYQWGSGADRCSMRIETTGPGFIPEEGSLSQFITEHYWGYATQGKGSLEYEVQHPQWLVRNAEWAEFSGNAYKYYGREFAEVLKRDPDSAFLADGSSVTVYKGSRIE
jgi:hypothetical protein